MNRVSLLPTRLHALVTGGLLLLAVPAGAKDAFNGIITFNNTLGNINCSCTGGDPGYLASPLNDLGVAPLAGFNGVYPAHDFQPNAGTIASGSVDQTATIAYPDGDNCDNCGAQRVFQQTCYRGAIDPNGADWTAGWTVHGHLVNVYPSGWETREFKFLAGAQPTSFWDADTIYVLQGKVFFPAGTTLTIQANTLVVGENASGGYLVIERDADIVANGTVAQPIVMATDLDPPISGGWGGLVIHGKAVANCADCLGGASCLSEGGAGNHCGTNDCDNSGSLQYVRIAYSGIEISPNNELNCFTFNSVGSQTVAHHLQAHEGSDDAFEWFGGKANAQFLVGTGTGDDGLDWQMGFRGTVQYAINQLYPFQGDKGIEADNNEFNFDAPCRSNPLMANLTLIGNQAGGATNTHGIHFRRGTDGQVYNSILADNRQNAVRIENDATCAGGLNPITAAFCGPGTDAPVVASSSSVDIGVRAFPNPVVSGTSFRFSLPVQGLARLDVFDVTGRRVANVVDGQLEAGLHDVAWTPATTLAAGTYFYRLETASRPSQGRLTLVR